MMILLCAEIPKVNNCVKVYVYVKKQTFYVFNFVAMCFPIMFDFKEIFATLR